MTQARAAMSFVFETEQANQHVDNEKGEQGENVLTDGYASETVVIVGLLHGVGQTLRLDNLLRGDIDQLDLFFACEKLYERSPSMKDVKQSNLSGVLDLSASGPQCCRC